MPKSAIVVGLLAATCGIAAQPSYAQSTSTETRRATSALEAQTKWLATSPEGVGWTRFLRIDQLREQLAAANPNRSVIEQVIERYRSARPGLENPAFAAVRLALEQWLAQVPMDPAELVKFVRAARDQYIAPQPAHEGSSRAKLQSALARLETYLTSQGAIGNGWRVFLRIDELQAQLRSPQPDLDRLAEVARKFSSGHFGLQLAPFDRTRSALEDYLHVARALKDADAAARYAADIDRLATLLEQYSAQPSPEASAEIGEILGRLTSAGQASRIVAAVRSQYARPNLFLRVSDDFVARALAEHVVESEAVREFIQGTRIRGSAQTTGDVTLKLVPSDQNAVLQAVFLGTTRTKTVGVNGPARIYSSGTTRLTGQQVIYIDTDGIHAAAPTTQGKTSLRTNGIGTSSGGIRGCIVERVASKRVAEAKPSAERMTSRKAESRLKVRLSNRVDKLVFDANQRYWQQIRQPLVEKNQFPRPFLIRTTADELLASGALVGPTQLGAASVPPDLSGDADIAIRLHETAVNNYAQGMLAGETLHSDRVQAQMLEITGELPEQSKDEEAKAPWSITFADQKPIEVHFDDDSFTITIRGKQYTSDDRTYRAMNVTAVYKIESSPQGMKAVRQGDLQIFPPGFVPGQRRFSVPEQTLRSMLERRFGRMFTPELGGEPIVPPGRFKKVGPLTLSNLATKAGWVTVGLRPAGPDRTAVADAD